MQYEVEKIFFLSDTVSVCVSEQTDPLNSFWGFFAGEPCNELVYIACLCLHISTEFVATSRNAFGGKW